MGKAGPESAGAAGAASMADPCGTLNQAVAPSSGATAPGMAAAQSSLVPPAARHRGGTA